MSYSDQDMKEIILGLAAKADPLEADALRSVAANYDNEKRQETFLELSFRQIMTIAGCALLVWTPICIYFTVNPGAKRQPPGAAVEMISGFTPEANGFWRTRTYRFAPQESFTSGERKFVFTPDAVPLVVYEDLTPLPKANYEFQHVGPANIWRWVYVKPLDGSDPNTNGHAYYAVSPSP